MKTCLNLMTCLTGNCCCCQSLSPDPCLYRNLQSWKHLFHCLCQKNLNGWNQTCLIVNPGFLCHPSDQIVPGHSGYLTGFDQTGYPCLTFEHPGSVDLVSENPVNDFGPYDLPGS